MIKRPERSPVRVPGYSIVSSARRVGGVAGWQGSVTCTWRSQRRARPTRAAAPRARARAPAWATAAKAPTCARTPAARPPARHRRTPANRAAPRRRLQHAYLRAPHTATVPPLVLYDDCTRLDDPTVSMYKVIDVRIQCTLPNSYCR